MSLIEKKSLLNDRLLNKGSAAIALFLDVHKDFRLFGNQPPSPFSPVGNPMAARPALGGGLGPDARLPSRPPHPPESTPSLPSWWMTRNATRGQADLSLGIPNRREVDRVGRHGRIHALCHPACPRAPNRKATPIPPYAWVGGGGRAPPVGRHAPEWGALEHLLRLALRSASADLLAAHRLPPRPPGPVCAVYRGWILVGDPISSHGSPWFSLQITFFYKLPLQLLRRDFVTEISFFKDLKKVRDSEASMEENFAHCVTGHNYAEWSFGESCIFLPNFAFGNASSSKIYFAN